VGQKIHPKGLRLGIVEDWDTVWYAEGKDYAKFLSEDIEVRRFLKEILYRAGISKIKISRRANQVEVDIYTARPGLIIGKGGRDIAVIREKLTEKFEKQVQLNVHEEKNPEACAQLVAESVAAQLEKRVAFRRAMKQAIARVLKVGGQGVKIKLSGRLGGSEIARKEWYLAGRVPLQTLRAKVEYGFTEAMTIYGKIGVKVWVYKGDVIEKKEEEKIGTGAEKDKV
jgi:small subunit ribosomal protein S3